MSNNSSSGKKPEQNIKIYGAPGSTLQTPEEHQHDQQVDPGKNNTMDVSNDDLRDSDADRMHTILDGKRGDDPAIDDRLSDEK